MRDVKARLWGYYYHQAAGSNYTVMVTDDMALKDDEVVIGHGVLRTWGTVREKQLYHVTSTDQLMVNSQGFPILMGARL